MIPSTGKLLDYRDFLRFGKTFIETGSGHGSGIQRALDAGFEKIVSIEAHGPNFTACQKRFSGNENIKLVFGLSQILLPAVLETVSESCVVFLDAHPSGLDSYGHKELMKGNSSFSQDTIIREELNAILRSPFPHAIILDDMNGHLPTCESYCEIILNKHPDYQFAFYDENLGKFYKDKILVVIPSDEKHQSQRGIERCLDDVFSSPGYFLEIGAWDGELLSQTAWLEHERSWTGTCVEPFPANFESRTCNLIPVALSADGKPRKFVKVSSDRRDNGNVSYLSGFKENVEHSIHGFLVGNHCDFEEVEIGTMAVAELFKRLPRRIDFLSVDVEGAELEIFQNIPFSEHDFGLIAFEHGANQSIRNEIGGILSKNRYRLFESWEYDDIYVEGK